MKHHFVSELERDEGNTACLVKLGDDYFVISSITHAQDHGGPETLAFSADQDGEITSYTDVAGGIGWTREQTISELESKGADPSLSGRGIPGETQTEKFLSTIEMFRREVMKL